VTKAKNALSYTTMIALAVFLMAPFVWMVLVSLHPNRAPIPTLDNLVPAEFHWENYTTVLLNSEIPVGRFFFNSFFVAGCVVFGQLLVCSLAAYGFARLRFKGRDSIFVVFLLSMMFAGPVTQIPVYLMLRNFGWLDTYLALIVPGVSSAFAIFLLRQFFMQIPLELDEAARIDGASDLKIYWRLIMPMSKAALARAVARGNGWYGFALDVDATARCVEGLREAAKRIERPAGLGPLEISVTPAVGLDRDTVKRFEDLGVQRLIPLSPARNADEVVEFIERTAQSTG